MKNNNIHNNRNDERKRLINDNKESKTPLLRTWSLWGKAIIGTQLLLFIIICGILISGSNKNNNKNNNNIVKSTQLDELNGYTSTESSSEVETDVYVEEINIETIDIDTVHVETTEITSDILGEESTTHHASPNIIFVLADDLGWNSLGYQDFDLSFATPFLTGLANDGVIISNYYSQEVCTPARASLLTGRYPLTLGMQYGVVEPQLTNALSLDETTIAEVLRDEGGYTSYMLGKWHLGHHSPLHLPTARGFDSFLGFVLGENYYWSKKYPSRSRFTDFMDADTDCYQEYEGDDKHTYSTFFYRDKAKEIIKNHDASDPMFLFLSFQAVHSPFFDKNKFENGIPKEYVPSHIEKKITKHVVGRKRREYAMSLAILDDAVEDIYDELVDRGIMDNSYFIFASDNGGCYAAGGKNGPLRGTKGSLFEGGVRVDAFVYSKLLPVNPGETVDGRIYTGLMHVSDWFPTIMAMAIIDYEPPEGKELDGYNQLTAFVTNNSPRDYILYNYFTDVEVSGNKFDMWSNGTFAIRDTQYKLMHSFNTPTYTEWYDYDEYIENDDSLDGAECSQQSSLQGSFTYYLYDLINDPYETNNLYYSPDPLYTSVKDDLYTQLETYRQNSKYQVYDTSKSVHAFSVWKQHNNLVSPWTNNDDVKDLKKSYGKTYPDYCGETVDDDRLPVNRHHNDDADDTGHIISVDDEKEDDDEKGDDDKKKDDDDKKKDDDDKKKDDDDKKKDDDDKKKDDDDKKKDDDDKKKDDDDKKKDDDDKKKDDDHKR